MSRRNSGVRALGAGIVLAAGLATAGCEDYLDRRDTMTLGVGDAVAVNKATQTINRWPASARKDRWQSDGERARAAVSRYRAGKVYPPNTLGSSGQDGAASQTTESSGSATTGN